MGAAWPDSCHRGTSLSAQVEGVEDRFRGGGQGVLGEVFVAGVGDANLDLLDRSQGVDDLLDAHPGGVLQLAGDAQRGEHDGQVGFDRVAGVVEDRAGS